MFSRAYIFANLNNLHMSSSHFLLHEIFTSDSNVHSNFSKSKFYLIGCKCVQIIEKSFPLMCTFLLFKVTLFPAGWSWANKKKWQTVDTVGWNMVSESLSRVRLSVTPWTVAHQTPPPMGFSRQKYCSGLPFPSPGERNFPFKEVRRDGELSWPQGCAGGWVRLSLEDPWPGGDRDPAPYLNMDTPSLQCCLGSKRGQGWEGRLAEIHSDLQEEECLRAELHCEHRCKDVGNSEFRGRHWPWSWTGVAMW